MSLPYDYERCGGITIANILHKDGPPMVHYDCIACLRRTSPGRDDWQSHIAPHAGPGPCPNRIGEGE